MNYIAASLQILQDHNLKKTKARTAILNLFAKTEKPISAYQIQDQLTKKGINITTVYRTLQSFEDIGLVHYLASQSSYFRCDPQILQQSTQGHHSFAICDTCHSVEEFIDTNHSHHLKDFKCLKHIQEVLGICPQCTNS